MMKPIYLLMMSVLLFSSCVTKKKYLIAENGRIAALYKDSILTLDLNKERKITANQAKQISELLQDTTQAGRMIRDYRKMLNMNLSEQEKMGMILKDKMAQLVDRENKINELQSIIDNQNAKVSALLNSVKDALMGFSTDELSVTQKDGKVYLSMSDKLLFESGSAKVDKRGKEALALLAQVLNKQSDIDVFIEGHTDNKPIKTVQFKDNWDLSVIRATSVVRILTQEYGVNPLQIVPTGRAEFMPVADNNSADGRSRNRRTEIIMAPKLNKLIELLNEK